jgi:serine/threonine-protein kinase
VEPGAIVGDKYRVGRQIGRGGMGVIVEATHVQLGTKVAIKILKANREERPEVAERFLQEARAAAQLKNEHICRVHDYGTLPDNAPFMVMELLEGRDLGSLVDVEGPLDYKLVAHYVIQACAGLAEAHGRGLIHRDLKPGNLFLEIRPDGSPFIKILDFGIAKDANSDLKLTQTQSVMGSPCYMAPEQLRKAKIVDTRTDIWALGVVMYELLTETLPFPGDDLPELVMAITGEPPPPLPGGKIPAKMVDLVYKCLDKDPNDRFQSVGELAEALAPFAELDGKQLADLSAAMLAPRPHAATRANRAVDELLAKETTLRTATGAMEEKPLPKGWLAAALVGALAIGLGGWLVLRGKGGEDEPPPPPPQAAVPVAADAAVQTVIAPDAAPPPDAAVVEVPPDAAEPAAVASPTNVGRAAPPEAVRSSIDAGVPAETPPKKKRPTHRQPPPKKQQPPPDPADIGKSRL